VGRGQRGGGGEERGCREERIEEKEKERGEE